MRTTRGPHVTPELFTAHGDRLLCLLAATTLKAKVLRRDPVVAVAARAGTGSLTGIAVAEVIDVADPASVVAEPLAATAGVARFLRDNAAELAGAAVQALTGQLGRKPPRRLALALRLVAATACDGDRIEWSEGWDEVPPGEPGREELGADDPTAPDLAGIPEHLAALVEPGAVVLGWCTEADRPVALPARWLGDGRLTVPAGLLAATGAARSSAACVTFDAWSGLGPTGKQGLLLRGTGTMGEDGAVVVETDRITTWDGIATDTTELRPPS